ncbi:MAG: hypothetical protein KME27_22145 [Lyngbya sp. HA4199-MV5]|jgi:hypothetical protein|nr:hypothetical protein [Lyngbya sp. HA4199-MV5]
MEGVPVGLGLVAVMIILFVWLISSSAPLKLSLIVAAGTVGSLFWVLAGVFNWNWVFERENVQPVVKRLGRTSARLLFFVGGLGMAWGCNYMIKILLIMGFLYRAKHHCTSACLHL